MSKRINGRREKSNKINKERRRVVKIEEDDQNQQGRNDQGRSFERRKRRFEIKKGRELQRSNNKFEGKG